MPMVVNNVHESVYKSYQTLQLVKEMIHRGDSIDTILDIILLIEE